MTWFEAKLFMMNKLRLRSRALRESTMIPMEQIVELVQAAFAAGTSADQSRQR